MSIKAKVRIKENVSFIVRDKNGKIKPLFQWNWLGRFFNKLFSVDLKWGFCGNWVNEMKVSNLIVNAGKAEAAALLGGVAGGVAFTYIAVGTGTTAANATDTALETEVSANGFTRAATTNSQITTTVTNDTLQAQKNFTATGSQSLSEAGLFNDASAGDMFARNVYSSVPLANGDNFQVTWQIDMSI